MAYTTTNAIRAAIESTIVALDPNGAAMGRGAYAVANQKHEWDDRPDTDRDRRFTVDYIEGVEPTMFGTISEIDYAGTLTLRIGHKKADRKQDALDRKNTDLDQIRQNLEAKSNFPSGVSLVRYSGMSTEGTEDESQFWLTELAFNIWFTLASP